MADKSLSETPIDLLNSGRDELIDGSGPSRIVPQLDPAAEALAPAEPKSSHRTDTSHREVLTQSAILQRGDLEKLVEQKPR